MCGEFDHYSITRSKELKRPVLVRDDDGDEEARKRGKARRKRLMEDGVNAVLGDSASSFGSRDKSKQRAMRLFCDSLVEECV